MDQLIAWIRRQQPHLDQLIARSTAAAFAAHPEWSDFECAQSLEDTWELSRGGDCCYDRPSIGPTYASWYHARRMQDVLRHLLPWRSEPGVDAWTVIDLGCGSGATLWSLALIALAVREVEPDRPLEIEYIGIDSSLFMLEHAERMWHEHFVPYYPQAADVIKPRFGCRTWTTITVECRHRPRVVGSYLLDHSDDRHSVEIAAALHALVERHSAGRVLLLSAEKKVNLLQSASKLFGETEWEVASHGAAAEPIWSGELPALRAARQRIYGSRAGIQPRRWSNSPLWNFAGSECRSIELTARQAEEGSLYGRPRRFQSELDGDQEKAAAPAERATVIVGAAGSGKSFVLSHRIAETALGGVKRILVTAFNKAVIDQLAQWVEERLRDRKWTRCEGDVRRAAEGLMNSAVGSWVITSPDRSATITFMNWDLVMTRLVGVQGFQVLIGRELERELERTARLVEEDRSRRSTDLREILRPSFVEAEKHRVLYGLSNGDLHVYRKVIRIGRGRRISEGQRDALVEIFRKLDGTMLIDRRIAAVKQIQAGSGPLETFDRTFVDEVQDFTPADFDILHALGRNHQSAVVAGDLSQSMQIGSSHRIPPLPNGHRWRRFYLPGSYRIPLRICECLLPLAENIARKHGAEIGEDAVLPHSRKSAVLGVRPILVFGRHTAEYAEQLIQIWSLYSRQRKRGEVQPYDKMTIAERDWSLGEAVGTRAAGSINVELESMNRIKGLERSFVVWSTRVPLERVDESEDEWIYTILSRAKHILVLAVGPETLPFARELIRKRLLKTRIMPWTQEAKRYLGE